jgi:DNA (cytosine-5)-methyltransferase 1
VRILDLFCGVGGAAMGLHQALPEAEIVGVDIKPQPRYPFTFIQADAMTYPLEGFNFIWASPPCQRFSAMNNRFGHRPDRAPDLIDSVRQLLLKSGTFYVIENVPGAPLHHPVVLCGSMFNLQIPKGCLRRHRLFESNFPIKPLKCRHSGKSLTVAGHGATDGVKGGMKASADEARALMEMNWATRDGVAQAIPPAYSRYIGEQFKLSKENPCT